MQSYGAQSQWLYLQNTPAPKAQRTYQKRGWKDCKIQRIKEFAVRLHLLGMAEAVAIKSHQLDCLNMNWTRQQTTIDISRLGGGESTKPQPYTKDFRQLRNTMGGRNSVSQGRSYKLPTQFVSNTKWSALKTYTYCTYWVYTYTHIHNDRVLGIYGRAWGMKRKGRIM